eukprot:Skav234812  [mRNA]  locus=scaffold69:736214:737785:- [translate_table: standard]
MEDHRWQPPPRIAGGPLLVTGPGQRPVVRSATARRSASTDSETADVVDDWRRFRARLLEREDSLTEGAKDTLEKGWIHRSPLIEKGSVLLAKPGDTWRSIAG